MISYLKFVKNLYTNNVIIYNSMLIGIEEVEYDKEVALLLMLNMTVAIGTLNRLISYANVLCAYKSMHSASVSRD